MKRHPSLRDLSDDHHHGLVHARRLLKVDASEVSDQAKADRQEVAFDFLRFFSKYANSHFREEEEVLLPAFARHGDPSHPSITQMLVEHIQIRRLVFDLQHEATDGQLSIETMHAAGALLQGHIRLEENVVFPLIEQTMSEEALATLPGLMAEFQANASN